MIIELPYKRMKPCNSQQRAWPGDTMLGKWASHSKTNATGAQQGWPCWSRGQSRARQGWGVSRSDGRLSTWCTCTAGWSKQIWKVYSTARWLQLMTIYCVIEKCKDSGCHLLITTRMIPMWGNAFIN
jgi:hypothetical protein